MKKLENSVYTKYRLNNVINISTVVTIHYFELDKNFSYPGEAHDFWEMVYVDSGEIVVTAGNNDIILKQGEVVFHKPNEFHAISSNRKSPANVFIISFVTSSKSMDFFKNKRCIVPNKLKTYLKTLMEEGTMTFDLSFNNFELRELKLSDNVPFGGQQIIRTTLEQFLIMLIRTESNIFKKSNDFSEKGNTYNRLVFLIIEILNENIYGKITVDEICKSLNYSKTYISKIFNKYCNCTIIDYYTNLKINEAKILIRENIYNFTQISDMLCFDNPHYFTRVFKRITNMTPSAYKQSIINR